MFQWQGQYRYHTREPTDQVIIQLLFSTREPNKIHISERCIVFVFYNSSAPDPLDIEGDLGDLTPCWEWEGGSKIRDRFCVQIKLLVRVAVNTGR